MLVVKRNVFYCEFCKRHRLTALAIEKHEPRCIYNPNRSACGWHDDKKPYSHAATLALNLKDRVLKEGEPLDWLRIGADGCPACMLAAVAQADLTMWERDVLGFDYTAEVERFRQGERELARGDAW